MTSQIKGAILVAGAMFSFSVMNALVKFISPEIPSIESVFFRGLVGAISISLWAVHRKISLGGNNRKLLLARSISGTLSLVLIFHAFTQMPLSSAMLLAQATPVFMVPLAVLFLKEHVTRVQITLIFVAFVGLVMVIQPDSTGVSVPAAMALGSAFFAAIAYILIRYLATSDEPIVVVFWFSAVSSLAVIPLMIPVFVVPSLQSTLCLIALSAFGLLGQIFLTQGYQMGEAGKLAVVGSTGAVFGVLWDLLFWHHLPDAMTIFGGIIVIVSCAAVQMPRKKRSVGEL